MLIQTKYSKRRSITEFYFSEPPSEDQEDFLKQLGFQRKDELMLIISGIIRYQEAFLDDLQNARSNRQLKRIVLFPEFEASDESFENGHYTLIETKEKDYLVFDVRKKFSEYIAKSFLRDEDLRAPLRPQLIRSQRAYQQGNIIERSHHSKIKLNIALLIQLKKWELLKQQYQVLRHRSENLNALNCSCL